MWKKATIFLTLLPTPALACHHYSRWYYPYPQPKCGLAARGTDPQDHSWYVEFVFPELDERQQAIEKLKELMK